MIRLPKLQKNQESEPMDFQKKAAERLMDILKVNSRAFLADEPGLGKTFTSAMLMTELAGKVDNKKPFFVIYVAPNLTLLESNGGELVRKALKYKSKLTIKLLSDYANPKDYLKKAYDSYFDAIIEKNNSKIKEISNAKIAIEKEMLEPGMAKVILNGLKNEKKISQPKMEDILGKLEEKDVTLRADRRLKQAFSSNQYQWKKFKEYYYNQYKNILISDIEKKNKSIEEKKNEIKKKVEEYESIAKKKNETKNETKGKAEKNKGDLRYPAIRKTFVNNLHDNDNSLPDYEKIKEYYQSLSRPDRLLYAEDILNNKEINDNDIIIITISAEIALGEAKGEEEKKEYKDRLTEKVVTSNYKNTYTKYFLEKYKPGLIIWDEYHRYVNKLINSDNPFFNYEEKENMKSLFVSATPYRSNISGDENKEMMEELYKNSIQTVEPDDESPDVKLPSFEGDFVPLFCGGKHSENTDENNKELVSVLNEDALKEAYNSFVKNTNNKGKLEAILKQRMVRNERNRLQSYYEEHICKYSREKQNDDVHKVLLKNTIRQCRNLKKAGYQKGALVWSTSLPWVLCFSTNRTNVKREDGKYTYYECLNPEDNNINTKELKDGLFVYDDNGNAKADIMELPNQNLAFYQICNENISDKKAAQLIWMPPSFPLFKSGDKSIFYSYHDYSKLLVFAEYRYLQRGGARLLSDYCKKLLMQDISDEKILEEIQKVTLKINKRECCKELDINRIDSSKTLEDVLKNGDLWDADESTINKLYMLASPASCADRLGLDPDRMLMAFNDYFNKSGVKEALISWLYDNNYLKINEKNEIDKERIEEGLLRYCAEGNLYSVLEEWLFCMKTKKPKEQMSLIEDILNRGASKVGVQTLKSTEKPDNGIVGECGFAEQLTGDVNDVGAGENEDATKTFSSAFNSPFYPMILFAGRGAQEGIDMHTYCLRIMHLTLPRGAVSFEQRNGRIDRYRSLLVRRRAVEYFSTAKIDINDDVTNIMARMFQYLNNNKPDEQKNNLLFPNWSIPKDANSVHNSVHNFERMMPAWNYTNESCFIDSMEEMLQSYRESLGMHKGNSGIDLSTTQ